MTPFLLQEKTGLWIIDVQERLFPHIDRGHEVLEKICLMMEGAKILGLPFIVTEQSPKALGKSVLAIRERLPEGQVIFSKTAFSGYRKSDVQKAMAKSQRECWILAGIEAHICVLQTAKDLLLAQKQVIILNDAVSSRSLFDFSTALGELREAGARVSSTETILYELLQDSAASEFKAILSLVKNV